MDEVENTEQEQVDIYEEFGFRRNDKLICENISREDAEALVLELRKNQSSILIDYHIGPSKGRSQEEEKEYLEIKQRKNYENDVHELDLI